MSRQESFDELHEFSMNYQDEKVLKVGMGIVMSPLGIPLNTEVIRSKKYRGPEKVLNNLGTKKYDYSEFNEALKRVVLVDSSFISKIQDECDVIKLANDIENVALEAGLKVCAYVKADGISIKVKYSMYDETSTHPLKTVLMLVAYDRQCKHHSYIIPPTLGLHRADEHLESCLQVLSNCQTQVILFFHDPVGTSDLYMDVSACGLRNKGYHCIEFDREIHYKQLPVREAARRLIINQEKSLEDKIALANQYFDTVFSYYGKALPTNGDRKRIVKKMALGMSFGMDSMAMFALMDKYLQSRPELKKPDLVFCDTRIEHLKHYEFANEMKTLFESKGYNVVWEKTKVNFFNLVEDQGFPMLAKTIRQKSNPELHKRITELNIRYCGNNCCVHLKENVASEVYDRLSTDLVLVGLRASESDQRRQLYYRNYNYNVDRGFENDGEVVYVAGESLFKAYPILHFSKNDILSLNRMFSIPVSPVYSLGYSKVQEDGTEVMVKYGRTGCRYCAMGLMYPDNNIALLRHTDPKDWELLLVKKGLGKEIYRLKENVPLKSWNKKHEEELNHLFSKNPSYFDIVRI